MVAGTGFIVACAVGAYIYLTNKRACDEKLQSWIEQLSETQADSEDKVSTRSIPSGQSDLSDHEAKLERATRVAHDDQGAKLETENTKVKEEAAPDLKKKKGTQLSEGSEHKKIQLERQLVENIIRQLRSAEDAASSPRLRKDERQKGPATNAVQPQPAIVYQYPYAPNGPLIYPNAPAVYQQSNVPPGFMIQPSAPVISTAVQKAPISSSRYTSTNDEDKEKRRKKRRKSKRKTSKRKHHKTKREGKGTESTDEEEKNDKKKKRKSRRSRGKSKHSKHEKEHSEEGAIPNYSKTTMPKSDSIPTTPTTPTTPTKPTIPA